MYDDFDRGTRRAVLKLYRATDMERSSGALAATLRALDRPALVIWGAHDPYVPVRYAALQREAFPSAKVVILDESGHWPFADDPASVANEVVPFLRVNLQHEADQGFPIEAGKGVV
jgi:pimeloyl-ACP methyl ester carboxylesterase